MSHISSKFPLHVFALTAVVFWSPSAVMQEKRPPDLENKTHAAWFETERLMLSDLPAAYENAKSSWENAKERGDKNEIEIAWFDVMVTRHMSDGDLDELTLEQLRTNLKRKTAPLECNPHSTMTSVIAAMMFNLSGQLLIEPVDEACRAIQLEKNIRRRDQMVGTLISAVQKSQGPKGLESVVERIGEKALRFSGPTFWDQGFIDFLANYRFPEYKQKSAQVVLNELEQIESNIDSEGNRYQQFRINCYKSSKLRKLEKWSEEESLAHENFDLISQIGAGRLKVMTQMHLARIKKEEKKVEELTRILNDLVESPELEGLSEAVRNSFSRELHGMAFACPPEQRDIICKSLKKHFISGSESGSIVKKIRILEEKANQSVAERKRADEFVASIKTTSAELLSEKQSEASFFRNFAILSSIGMIALIPWLFLYLQQRRLSRAKGEIKEGKELLKDLNLRISRMERTESLGLMAGSIAHDFNNILVGVMGNAELLQMKRSDSVSDPFIADRINSIIGSAQKAADLARQMLAYAGRQQVTKKNLELNTILRQNSHLFESSCLRQTFVLDLDSGEIPVVLDSNLFERAVLNLVTNASQASDQGALITIKTGRVSKVDLHDPTMFGVSNHQGEFGFLEVIDHGKGISDSDREHIFEPFYTKSQMGKGLGLSVVYGMVKCHNGLIQCISEAAKGTRFRIYLPISDTKPGSPVSSVSRQLEKSEPVELGNPMGKTVLVIDDEEGVREVCKELLESANWRVLTAKDGSDGLEIAVRDYQSIDCILMDIVLPDLSANEILIEMENKQIRTPVVLMSGFSKIQLEKFRERVNVVSIISKPFRSKDVLEAALEASRQTIECDDERFQSNRNSTFEI